MAATRFQAAVLQRIARSRIECNLFRGSDDELRAALDAGSITFHEGRIGGAWPRIVER